MRIRDGRVAELADAQDLKSCVRSGRAGSSPASATLLHFKPAIPVVTTGVVGLIKIDGERQVCIPSRSIEITLTTARCG